MTYFRTLSNLNFFKRRVKKDLLHSISGRDMWNRNSSVLRFLVFQKKNLLNFPLSALRPFSVTGVTSHILSCIWWFRQNKPFIFWKSITLCQNMIIKWWSSFHFYLDFHPFLLRHSSFPFTKYLLSSLSDCVNQRSSRHPSQHRHTLRPIFLFGNRIVYKI